MDRKAVETLFREIDGKLPKNVAAIAIGGAAMVMRGQKEETIDVDFIALTEEDRNILISTLESLGFTRKLFGTRFDHPDGRRVEVDVGGFLQTPLSKRMKIRAGSPDVKFKKLQLSLLSDEDVILFKSMTEREKDVRDIMSILSKSRVNWGTILDEAEKLALENKDVIYPAFVAAKLREVKDAGGPVDEKTIRKFEDLGVKLYGTAFKKKIPISVSERARETHR